MTTTAPADLPALLHTLRSAWQAQRPTLDQREADLRRLRAALKDRLDEMAAAIAEDFGHRAHVESKLADGMSVLSAIDHLRRHLRRWSKPQRVGAGWRLWPARAQLRPMPLGVVGVISPWNYPVTLALVPLATAIAAGNHVLLKPSEHTPRTSAFLADLLASVFPPDRVSVVQGDADVAAAVSSLPLDHLVFTGSTAVGRKVMAAAAEHLVPLTLELGGKSPAIVCRDFPLDKAAARLATGKWFNAGQTCIAPDYVLIDSVRQREFVQALQQQVRERYGDFSDADDYTRIINEAQYRRLQGYLAQARERPLALYPFSHDTATVERILGQVLAGGVTVNDTLLHFAADGLPFGGVGASGMGAYHGRAGFDAMSKLLPVLWQSRWAASDRLRPPYSKIAGLLKLLLR